MGGFNIKNFLQVPSARSFAHGVVTRSLPSQKLAKIEAALVAERSEAARDLVYLLGMIRKGEISKDGLVEAERAITALANSAIRFDDTNAVAQLEEALALRSRASRGEIYAECGFSSDSAMRSSMNSVPFQTMGSRKGGARGRAPAEEIASVTEARRLLDEAERLQTSSPERAVQLYERVIAFYKREDLSMEEVQAIDKLILLFEVMWEIDKRYGKFDERYFELLERGLRLCLKERWFWRVARILMTKGEAKANRGFYKEAIAAFQKAADIWKTLDKSDEQAMCLYKKAGALQDAGRVEEAWETLIKAQQLFGSHMPFDLFPDFATRLRRFLEAMPDSSFDAEVLELVQAHGIVEHSRLASLEDDIDRERAEGNPETALLGFKMLLSLYGARGDQADVERIQKKIEEVERRFGKKPS